MAHLLPVFADMSELAPAEDHQEYYAARKDAALFRPAVAEICRRHGLPADDLRKYPGGAMVVFAAGGDHAIKLFPPMWPHHYKVELACYRAIHGRLGVDTPRVIAAGQLEAWSYIAMSQLPGEDFQDLWPTLTSADKRRLIADFAAMVARLHALPLDGLDELATDWPANTATQARNCVALQRKGGLGDHWLDQIPAYLERWVPQLPGDFAPALLNTELGGFSTLTRRDGQWAFCGLGDFADAFVGHCEYEFAAVGIFVSRGDPELFRTFLLNYGYRPDQLTVELSNRIMVYTLLHRYSNLQWYLEELPPPPGVETIADLAQHFFAC